METNTQSVPLQPEVTPPPFIVKKGLNKDFSRDSSVVPIGFLIIVMGVLLIIITGTGGILIASGVIFITLSFHTPLKFREDHFIFKGAPAAKTTKISYSALGDIEYEKKKIIFYDQGKKVTIPKALFNSKDWDDINRLFKSIKPEQV